MKRAGIDIGTMYAKAVVLDDDDHIIKEYYSSHNGDRATAHKEAMKAVGTKNPATITGTGDPELIGNPRFVDPVAATRIAVTKLTPSVHNVIDVGFANVTLVELGERGRLSRISSNSLCAAGTGSFLDEQMIRLGLDYDLLKAMKSVPHPPQVASRCAVFAKTDIVHKQQEGFTTEQLWSGLCRSMAATVLQTLCKGKPIHGLTVLTGGVGLNKHFVHWLKTLLPDGLITLSEGHLIQAVGAAMSFDPRSSKEKSEEKIVFKNKIQLNAPILLIKSSPPEFPEPVTDESGNEIEKLMRLKSSDFGFFLGMDIGSTSTKAALLTPSGDVAASVYRRTLGDPIQAAKEIFATFDRLAREDSADLKIIGCATTGSGRQLVGNLIGADLVINEITAQAAGALAENPNTDVVFEIGGQDSKYILLDKKKRVTDCNMNFICAAGTGSFIEEQARKLGFALHEISEVVLGETPPRTSERCTVFMEQDVVALLGKGYSRRECMGAVCYSIVRNYLNKVVENRPLPKEKVVFQGATAKNKGLVAAFENTLGMEVVVSPHCHITGAVGAARLCMERMDHAKRKTTFKGVSLAQSKVAIRTEKCELCSNDCAITFASIEEGKEISWGYLCGRDPNEKSARLLSHYEPFKEYKKLRSRGFKKGTATWRVGIPSALTSYTYLPLWREFFAKIGAKVVVSGGAAEDIIKRGNALVGADFCFPIKLLHGHVEALLSRDDLDMVFLPINVSDQHAQNGTESFFCVYTQGAPDLITNALQSAGQKGLEKIWRPVIDLRFTLSENAKRMAQELYSLRGIDPVKTKKAFIESFLNHKKRIHKAQKIGRKILKRLESENRIGVVIVGRPYTVDDDAVNQKLPAKIAQYGYTVIPMECLPISNGDSDPIESLDFMYWKYGREITDALLYIAKHPRLYAVFLTNFNCGPDSFVLSYAQHISGTKPMLVLQMDEHSADAGYITRLEAFIDVIKQRKMRAACPRFPRLEGELVEFRKKKAWVPQIHPAVAELYAAALRGFNVDAHVLPLETRESHQLGLKVTRGSECLPTALTIGALLYQLEKDRADPAKTVFILLGGGGPCLLGQYLPLHRMILDRRGYQELEIFAPRTFNAFKNIGKLVGKNVWNAMIAGDFLLKMTCKVRPYEVSKGQADLAYQNGIIRLMQCLENQLPVEDVLVSVAEDFADIRVYEEKRPIIGIVGDFYVRFNRFSNEDVIRSIERYGGEAWLSPVIETIHYFAARPMENFAIANPVSAVRDLVLRRIGLQAVKIREKRWYKKLSVLIDRVDPDAFEIENAAKDYLSEKARSEAILNIGRAVLFAEQGAKMVVHCSPFGCMPGNLSTALFQKLQQDIGIPVVNMIYDGHGDQNRLLATFMANLDD